jgi:hypothetical protein
MLLLYSYNIVLMYIVCKHMDIHGYLNIHRIWIWSDIHAHGYFRGMGMVRMIDLDLDLVLQYLPKPFPFPSLPPIQSSSFEEVKFAIHQMPSDKASGPNGFTSASSS